MNSKTVQSGILRVALLGAVIMIIALILYYMFQYKQLNAVREYSKKDKELLIDRILSVTYHQYTNIVHDNSAWDECYQAMCEGNKKWLDDNIGYMIDGYKAAAVGMFDTLGIIKYENRAAGMENIPFYPFAGADMGNLFTKELFPHFYAKFEGKHFVYF